MKMKIIAVNGLNTIEMKNNHSAPGFDAFPYFSDKNNE
jgi:hypothetical protein